MIKQPYELTFPPIKIFMHEKAVLWNWEPKDDKNAELARVEFPDKGGILYYPHETMPPFPGFPFSPAVEATAIFKRFLILKAKALRNPLNWLQFARIRDEIDDMMSVSVRRYYLKPQYYCDTVRELYRVLTIVFNNSWVRPSDEDVVAGKVDYKRQAIDFRIHAVCSVLQWDSAYRYRGQNVIIRASKHHLRYQPRVEINRILKQAIKLESGPNVQEVGLRNKWRKARVLFNIAWMVPSVRKSAKHIFSILDINEFVMRKSDLPYAFKVKK